MLRIPKLKLAVILENGPPGLDGPVVQNLAAVVSRPASVIINVMRHRMKKPKFVTMFAVRPGMNGQNGQFVVFLAERVPSHALVIMFVPLPSTLSNRPEPVSRPFQTIPIICGPNGQFAQPHAQAAECPDALNIFATHQLRFEF